MEKMTIFYSKRTGSIKEACGGEQTMAYFGEEEPDFSVIYNSMVIGYDSFVMENIDKMYVVDGAIKIKESTIPDKYL